MSTVAVELNLEPVDNDRLANLCGQFDENLRLLERRTGVEIGNRGVHNFLVHPGILEAAPIAPPQPCVELDMQQEGAYVFSRHNGLLEPCVQLGDAVNTGDLIARVYATEQTGSKPVEYHAESDVIIMGRHFPSLIKIGDFMNVIARIV